MMRYLTEKQWKLRGGLRCCYVRDDGLVCPRMADFGVCDGPTPDDYTHSCCQHIGKMVQYDCTSTIYPIEMEREVKHPIGKDGSI